MKILTIVGARPQFIKAAAVSRVLRKVHNEVLLHTGQHHDPNMSDIFFKELEIPMPKYNLGIAGGTHSQMTGAMLPAIEEVVLREIPDICIVYGDTNSTLAGALAAVKLHVPVCHIEAGVRLGTLSNPEEINRICTDHVSRILMCCTSSSVDSLMQEGIVENVHFVGDPMYDAFAYYGDKLDFRDIKGIIKITGEPAIMPRDFYYLTCHREENTNDESTLRQILLAMNSLDSQTIYPVHPRNRKVALELSQEFKNIVFINPVGYLESIALIKNAKKIVTDSGGVQREAFFSNVQCVTVFEHVIWQETMVGNCNQLAKADASDIIAKLACPMHRDDNYFPFGDGKAAQIITNLLAK